jgi:hypothetical protein
VSASRSIAWRLYSTPGEIRANIQICLFRNHQKTAPAEAGAELSLAEGLSLALLAALSALSTLALPALSGLLALLAGLLLAAALPTLIGIVHDRSCVRLTPTICNGRRPR